jgi:hypothetical protein
LNGASFPMPAIDAMPPTGDTQATAIVVGY